LSFSDLALVFEKEGFPFFTLADGNFRIGIEDKDRRGEGGREGRREEG